MGVPSTYLIIFVCYGAWLPGQAGAVDRHHNLPGGPLPEENEARLAAVRNRMPQPPYTLDEPRREAVLAGLRLACARRNWQLMAAHVRTNHVHVVVQAEQMPERVMNGLKCYASRVLSRTGLDGTDRRRWARHGNTSYLWTKDAVSAAFHYVVSGQGDPMAVYAEAAPAPCRSRFGAGEFH